MEDYGIEWSRQNIRPSGRIGVANNSQGGLNLLVRDECGLLWEKQESKGRWTEWEFIDESGNENLDTGYGVTLGNYRRDGRMAAFGRDTRGEILFSFMEQGHPRNIHWKEMNAASAGGAAVCERCTGGIEAFHIDPDNQLWHIWTNPQGEWSQWQPLGGPVGLDVSLANNQEGFPQVFAKFPDSSVRVRRHHDDGTWGEWMLLKEKDVQRFASIQEADGRIRLAAADSEGRIQTCRQAETPDIWENWEVLTSEECTDLRLGKNEIGQTLILGIKYDGSLLSFLQEDGIWQRADNRKINIRQMETGELSNKQPCFIVTGQDGYLYIKEGM